MILASLRELAERERIVEEPAFTSRGVRWIIDIDTEGRFLSLTDTTFVLASSGRRKLKPQPQTMSIPRRSGRTSAAKAEFLVDKSEYVLGTVPAGEEEDPARSQRLHQLFVAEMQAAQFKLQSSEVEAALRFATDSRQRERCVMELNRQEYALNDLFTFRIEGRFLHELDILRAYWSELTNAPRQKGKRTWQCLVCGDECQPALKHEGVQLAGGGAHGVPLVSFGKPAFWKHGLTGNKNAPVCRSCMIAYTTALRRLLKGYPNPNGGTFEPQRVLLTGDTTAVFWSQEASPLVEQLAMLNEDPSALRELVNSPGQSGPPETPFYCLLLTGTIGRVIPRGMHTGTLGVIRESLKLYFECLHASGYANETPPLHVLLRSLAVGWRLDRLAPGLAGEIFVSAVLGQRLSRRTLSAAVGRSRIEQKVNRPRAAVLQLYFKLLLKKEFGMALDPESLDPAYRYGRLLAVLEGLQYSARQRKPTSTVVDHFYRAASTRPAIAFPQLLGKAQDDLHKLKTPRLVSRFERQIEQIMSGLDGAAGFRPTLNIEEQGRFALGYFHERAAHFSELENVPSGDVESQNLIETEKEEEEE